MARAFERGGRVGTRQKEAPHKKDNDNEVCLTNMWCARESAAAIPTNTESTSFSQPERSILRLHLLWGQRKPKIHMAVIFLAQQDCFLPSETAIILKPGAASTPTTSGTKLSITEFWIIK